MKKLLAWIVCFSVVSVNLFGSTETVDEFVGRYMKANQIPGLAVLVKQKGKIVLSKGYGYSNLEHMVPVKPETIFQSGSVGKQFTATGVMMLVEEGKLQVTDPISKYLNVPDTWKNITIHHMLSHTSGLGDYPEDFDLQKNYTEDDMLKMITAQPLLFSPGEKWNYSNLAFVTLGILIHKITGKFYGDFLAERIFQPLGMKSTRIINEEDIIPNRAAGYRLVKNQIKNQEWVSPFLNTTADGSLYFNIEDLDKWDAGLETEQLLKKTSLEKMWTPVVLNDGKPQQYGYGWEVFKTKNGSKLVEHSGEWQGFTTHIARYLGDRLTVVVLCNLANTDTGYIAHRIAGIYNTEYALPQHTAIKLDPSKLKSFDGQYRLEDRLTWKIKSDGEKLILEWNQRSIPLIPESETSFFVEDSERTIVFDKDPAGKVTGMTWFPVGLKFHKID
jgi:CubicO group peptidase (beta-lactamase class C family)